MEAERQILADFFFLRKTRKAAVAKAPAPAMSQITACGKTVISLIQAVGVAPFSWLAAQAA
jgi:hypothetical protein